MWARIGIIQGQQGKMDEGIREYREKTLPEARKADGFKGAYLLVDRGSGKMMSLTLWNTEKDLAASDVLAAKLRAQGVKTVSATRPPAVENYEVAVQG